MTSHFHIPGSFEPHALTGVHPNVFRPPTSPSSSTYLPPTTTTPHHHHHAPDPPAKRKRDDTRENTPTRDAGGRYVLADTPGGGGLDDSVYSDVAYRRQLGPREEDGEGTGWSSAALGAIGGVVGKVWEFCKAGAFRGFYAGGGRGYAMEEGEGQGGAAAAEQMGFGMGMSEDALRGFGMGRPEDTSGFSMENTAGTFEIGRREDGGRRFRMERPEDTPRRLERRPVDDPTPSRGSPTQPSAKRRHVNDELGRSWVMVDDPSRLAARRRSRNSSPSVTTGRRISTPVARLGTSHKAPTPRRSHRVSHAGSPALSPREPASFAAQRSPPVRSPTAAADFPSPSRIPLSSARPRRSNSTLASPSALPRPHRKSTSLTEPPNPRPPSSSAPLPNGAKTESPRLDPEARKLAARREREERDADLQMAAFNTRLQDMIREGREALGTSFEVEIEGGGEGDGWMDE